MKFCGKKSEKSAGRKGRYDLPAALAVALAAQALFWLPLGYREERIAAADNGENISMLGPAGFSEQELQRFEVWLRRHDPATFSRSDSPSGYAASLPAAPLPELPAAPLPTGVVLSKSEIPAPKPFEALKRTAVSRGVALPQLPAGESDTGRSLAAAVTVTDDRGRILDIGGRWQIPPHHTAVNPTILALAGLPEDPCWEIMQSCGDELLDTLAMRSLNNHRKAVKAGEWLLVHWRKVAGEVKK